MATVAATASQRRSPGGELGFEIGSELTAAGDASSFCLCGWLFSSRRGLRLWRQASSSEVNAYTELRLSCTWRCTGIASYFSQRWTVVTSRPRYAAISFHESSWSSGGFSCSCVPKAWSPIGSPERTADWLKRYRDCNSSVG